MNQVLKYVTEVACAAVLSGCAASGSTGFALERSATQTSQWYYSPHPYPAAD
jgi:hypothetical protein